MVSSSSAILCLIRQSIAEEMSNTAHPVLNSSLLMDEEDEEKLRRMKEEEKHFFFCGSDFAAQEALLGQNQNPSSSDTLSPQAPGDHSPPESESG